MRLARFNIQRAVVDKRYFAGLPSPAAAAALACGVYAFPAPIGRPWLAGAVGFTTVAIATLTISRLRYRSFKDLDLANRRSYLWVFPLAGVLVVILTHPEIALPSLSAVYVLSGPVGYFWGLAGRRRARAGESPRQRSSGEVLDESALR
jgi:CDP-diacylglycerol--serine O-phosphatidyltransferase